MNATRSTLYIDLTRTTDPSGLFAAEADMTGVDVQASMATFDSLLLAEVRAAYPDAIVELADRGRIWQDGDGIVNGFTNPSEVESAFEAGLTVQQLADDLLGRDDWIVLR